MQPCSRAEKEQSMGRDKEALLDHAVYPHIFRSILTFLPRNDLATILRTSRQTGKDAGDIMYRTVHLDLRENQDGSKRLSPLLQRKSNQALVEETLQPNVWVTARIAPHPRTPAQNANPFLGRSNTRLRAFIAGQRRDLPPEPIFAFPGDIMSHLRSTSILETGPHDTTSCTAFAKFTSPLSGLELWHFRPSHDIRHYVTPRTTRDHGATRCGRGSVYVIEGCADPTMCMMARHISPWHLVILPMDGPIMASTTDPLRLLTYHALQEMAPTVRKLTLTLLAKQIVPVRDYSIQYSGRSDLVAPLMPIHLKLFEMIILPDSGSDELRDFISDSATVSSAKASYLLRLRKTIVERLCDTGCHIRLVGSEVIDRSWLADVETLCPALNWSFEEELRCAVRVSRVAKQSTDEAKVTVRQARQDRLSFMDIREYASSAEGRNSLGEEEVGNLYGAMK